MKTAGVVFDFYDDLFGTFLKKAFPTVDDVPEVVKTAHILTPEEREELRDEAYALVMNVEGKTLRKFACVDEGNTVLSVLYFLENYDKLPETAIKVAAKNLESFCEEFGFEAPLTVKIAGRTGMSRSRDPKQQPGHNEDAEWSQRTNVVSVRGGADSGRVIPTASQMKTAESRQGGLALTDEKKDNGPSKKMPKLNVNGKIDFLDSFHKLNPEAEKKASIVDVSDSTTGFRVKRAYAETTALGGKFPLDAMVDVQKAIEYFEENYKSMEPVAAHIFAVKTAARAEELGIETTENLDRYGSTAYADDVDAHLSNRIAITPPEFREVYTELREKKASIHPEVFAEVLGQIDEESGAKWYYGGEVADPYYATFGKTASAWSWQSRTGDFVSAEELKWLAKNGRPLMHKHFSSDLVNGFMKDPIPVFESLPDDSKTILARLASGRFDGMNTN